MIKKQILATVTEFRNIQFDIFQVKCTKSQLHTISTAKPHTIVHDLFYWITLNII